MRRFLITCALGLVALGVWAPGSRALMSGVAYTDFANVFTANQRINAGLGINIAPGSTGTVKASAGLYDQGRSTAIGEITTVSYSSSNFSTSAGTMTWTVDAGDQISYKYALVGHTMFLWFAFNTTSVGGTGASTELRVAIPGGFTGHTNETLGAIRAYDNGTDTVGFCGTVAGASYVRCWRGGFSNWSITSTNNTSLQAALVLEVE